MKLNIPNLKVTTKELDNGQMVFSMDSSVELDSTTMEFVKLQHYMRYYIRCLALVHSDDWSQHGITISAHTGNVIFDDRELLFGISRALTFEQYKELFFGKFR